MRHETVLEAGSFAPSQEAAPCRYGGSRVLFRGPARVADGTHVAFVGGTGTHGRHLARPFPALLEELAGAPAINLGQANGGVDVMLAEPAIVQVARDARLAVVEVTGAQNLSNRFYAVHPRRNDRFVSASAALRALYPEVDFAEICFTRHLLSVLLAVGPERFPLVRAELQAAWSARMRTLLGAVGPRAVLLWLATTPPSDTVPEDLLAQEPLLVTRSMVEGLRPLVRDIVTVVSPGGEGGTLGEEAHRQAAEALAALLRARP